MDFYLLITSGVLLGLFLLAKINKRYRKGLIIVNTINCLFYISWRVTTIPWNEGIGSILMGVMLFLAEVLGLVAFFNFQYLFMGTYRPEKKTLNDYQEEEIPFVDVLICTYNEPLYLLEMTIAGAVSMRYPKNRFQVYVYDDGHRSELEELCRNYQI